MFDTEKKEEKRTFDIKVDAARLTKNETIIMIDLDVNGVKIKGCMIKEVTVKEDGKVHKKGEKCYILNFPSEKVGDKWYNKVWFPYSNADMENIIRQTKNLL